MFDCKEHIYSMPLVTLLLLCSPVVQDGCHTDKRQQN